MDVEIMGQRLVLSGERAIFWEEADTIILSDMHIGKGGHFRKAGIPIPGQVQDNDLLRLSGLLEQFRASRLVVTGDMFHSVANKELEKFARWREANSSTEILLIKGNHDILTADFYSRHSVRVEDDGFKLGPFVFSHEPSPSTGKFTISGHLHPGIAIRGLGKQKLRLPCFWLTGNGLVLPAFSLFTGLSLISAKEGDRVIGIVEGELMEVWV